MVKGEDVGIAKELVKFGHEVVIFYPVFSKEEVREDDSIPHITITYCFVTNKIGVHTRYD